MGQNQQQYNFFYNAVYIFLKKYSYTMGTGKKNSLISDSFIP